MSSSSTNQKWLNSMKTMDRAGELKDLFSRWNTKTIHRAIQDLRTKYNGEFDANTLFEKLEQIPPARPTGCSFTLPAAMILIALAIFLPELSSGKSAADQTNNQSHYPQYCRCWCKVPHWNWSTRPWSRMLQSQSQSAYHKEEPQRKGEIWETIFYSKNTFCKFN